jgi:hypothetical protein
MSFFEVAIAHSAVQFVMMVIQALEMMVVMYIVFDNPYNGSVMTGLALLLVVGCGGSVFGRWFLPILLFSKLREG